MQINSNTGGKYDTPFCSNTRVRAIAGASRNADGKLEFIEAEGKPSFVAELIDYQKFHKAWMSQGLAGMSGSIENRSEILAGSVGASGKSAELLSDGLLGVETIEDGLLGAEAVGDRSLGAETVADKLLGTGTAADRLSRTEKIADELPQAVTRGEEDGGEFLGLTMLPEEGKSMVYGMRAMLSNRSTPRQSDRAGGVQSGWKAGSF